MNPWDDPERDKGSRAAAYLDHVAERFTRVLQLTGFHAGPLARFFCANFVRFAKQKGRTRAECHRLVDQMWEEQEAAARVETVENKPS